MKKCSIYLVERPEITGDDQFAHSFLVRVDETRQTLLEMQEALKKGEAKPVVMDQIHMGKKQPTKKQKATNPEGPETLRAEFKLSARDISKFEAFPLVANHDLELTDVIWERMKEIAAEIEMWDFPYSAEYSPNVFNCRSAAIAIAKKAIKDIFDVDIEIEDDQTKAYSQWGREAANDILAVLEW